MVKEKSITHTLYEFKKDMLIPKGKAASDEQKETVIRNLLAYWKANPDLRLTQLISNAIPQGDDLYYTEDFDLIKHIQVVYGK